MSTTCKMLPGSFMKLLLGQMVLCFAHAADRAKSCERYPKLGMRQLGGVALTISGEPDFYVPGEIYTLSLRSLNRSDTSFTSFLIIAEDELEGTNQSSSVAGGFQSYDTKSKLTEQCPNAVSNADGSVKTEVQVMWTAPNKVRDGSCINLSGWASDGKEFWWEFRRRICAASAHPNDLQPAILEPCCACNEAKYEMVFEGLWSRHTHPKDFPKNESLTRFSDVIGASHTSHYRFWEIGAPASDGLRLLAEDGHTTTLETELKAESDHIRTIIKARGMFFPHLGGKTFAVFRVDSRHHLVSLVAQLSPSPDWIVGVSALELCRPNCTWTESKVLNLYPYDAGTDAGVSYMAPPSPQHPPGPVRPLNADWPKSDKSPFRNLPRSQLKPFARLYLNRQRLYEKSCEVNNTGTLPDPYSPAEYGACATSSWTAWSPCSVTCGRGVRHRRRTYKDMVRAAAIPCRSVLSDSQPCTGFRVHCRVPSEYEPEPDDTEGPCALKPWSEWSECTPALSKKCGRGIMIRSRSYARKSGQKKCHLGLNNKPQLQQTMECQLPDVKCAVTNISTISSTSSSKSSYIDAWRAPHCPVTSWSDWSACSATCGKGRRLRSRIYIAPKHIQPSIQRVLANLSNARFVLWQNENNHEKLPQELRNSLEEAREKLDKIITEHIPNCRMTVAMQEVACVASDSLCNITAEEALRICSLSVVVGPCRSYMERWFFDALTGLCEPFGYTGCHGNRNNFRTRDECDRVCGKYSEELKMKAMVLKKKKIATPTVISNDITMRDQPMLFEDENGIEMDIRDCIVTKWSSWSSCRGSCQHSAQHKYRHILQHPANGGRVCPKVLLRSRSCRLPYCGNRRHIRHTLTA